MYYKLFMDTIHRIRKQEVDLSTVDERFIEEKIQKIRHDYKMAAFYYRQNMIVK